MGSDSDSFDIERESGHPPTEPRDEAVVEPDRGDSPVDRNGLPAGPMRTTWSEPRQRGSPGPVSSECETRSLETACWRSTALPRAGWLSVGASQQPSRASNRGPDAHFRRVEVYFTRKG